MDKPEHNQDCKFLYCGKWWQGEYSSCRDWFYWTNHPHHSFIRFRDVEQWEKF